MTSKEYQNYIMPLIQDQLPAQEVQSEWYAFRGPRIHSSPRVDLAIGPFSIEGVGNQMAEYNHLLRENEQVRGFVRSIYDLHCENFRDQLEITPFERLFALNQNSRCLFAIEIENTNSMNTLWEV